MLRRGKGCTGFDRKVTGTGPARQALAGAESFPRRPAVAPSLLHDDGHRTFCQSAVFLDRVHAPEHGMKSNQTTTVREKMGISELTQTSYPYPRIPTRGRQILPWMASRLPAAMRIKSQGTGSVLVRAPEETLRTSISGKPGLAWPEGALVVRRGEAG